MVYSCCFNLGGYLDFQDFPPKSFISWTTYCNSSFSVSKLRPYFDASSEAAYRAIFITKISTGLHKPFEHAKVRSK